jgi:hypothetical protein
MAKSYLRAILPSLPNDIAKKIRTLCSSLESSELLLETLIQFISGAECAPDMTPGARTQWTEQQQVVTKILDELTRRPSLDTKRPREDDIDPQSHTTKRQRTSAEASTSSTMSVEPDNPVFTLHSISVTSPVRKKVHVAIHKSSLKFTNPSSQAVEAVVPLSSLTRAFLVPTRGKSKPHWTVVLLSSDNPDRGKPTNTSSSLNTQVIYGLDALAPSALTTTSYSAGQPTVNTVPKGSATKSTILTFLVHLGVPIFEPTPNVFKSVCAGAMSGISANEDGVPGVEAYRGAKQGSLWFMKEGILWGESKPCEFWAVEDLIGKNEGLRVVSASGRTCTVILTRKEKESEVLGDGANDEDGEDVGEETHFGLVDAREKPGIDAWVRAYRHLFGKKKETKVTIGQAEDDSDDEDESYEMKSEDDDDGSVSSSSSSESSTGGEGGSDEEGEEESAEDEDSEDENLKEERHPLMRPGAMPRMSRGVIDMVVGMVEEDMMGADAQADSDNEDLEEDELDD